MKTFQQFKAEVRSSRKGILSKIRNCYGTYDIYKYIRKNHWKRIGQVVSEHDFYAIVRGINKMMADEIVHGNTIKFPHGMGILELRKTHKGVSIVRDRLVNTYPIDWNNTLYLWYQDEEARKSKILLRHENEWVFNIKYSHKKSTCQNCVFYQFSINKEVKQALSQNIKAGKVDTPWQNKIYKDLIKA